METLIVYAGNTGSTEKTADIVSQKLKNVKLVNLLQEDPDISKFDLVVIGSNVRFGRLHKKARNFIAKNKKILLEKKAAYYICCGFPEKQKEYFENSIPKELLDKAVIYDSFGGELDLEKQKGIDKLIVKMVDKATNGKKEVKLLYDHIESFVTILNKEIGS